MKNSIKNKITKGVVSGLLCLMTASSLIPSAAFADDATTTPEHVYAPAELTVTGGTAGDNETWSAYKIFDADIADDGTATNLHFARNNTDAMGFSRFLAGLDLDGDGVKDYQAWQEAHNNINSSARARAEFFLEAISKDSSIAEYLISEEDSDIFETKEAMGVADRFSHRFKTKTPDAVSDTNGHFTGLTEGYYIIITTPETIDEGETGSAPMYVAVGGPVTTIESKSAPVSTTFQVKEDSTGEFGVYADSNTFQDLDYRVIGTLPANINAYSSYRDTYEFTLPAGISLAGTESVDDQSLSSVKIFLNNVDVTAFAETSRVNFDEGEHAFTISISDIKSLAAEQGIVLTGNDSVEVTYQAHVDGTVALFDTMGYYKKTSMVRTYTQDPVTLADRTSVTKYVTNETYLSGADCVDRDTFEFLSDAGFQIIAQTDVTADQLDPNYSASDPVYVQPDGSLGVTPYEFFTTSDITMDERKGGEFRVPNLDSGTYIFHESTVPEGYQEPPTDVTLTIEHNFNPETGPREVAHYSVTGGWQPDLDGQHAPMILNGCFALAPQKKAFVMPFTGLTGNLGLYALAGSLGLVGAAGIALGLRRRNNEQE